MTVTVDVTMVAEVVEAQEVLITNRPTVGEETTVEEVRVGVVLAEKKVEVCGAKKCPDRGTLGATACTDSGGLEEFPFFSATQESDPGFVTNST